MESVQLRQRGAYDFDAHYSSMCALQNCCPLPAVKVHLSQGVLHLNGDKVRTADWAPILNSIRINKSLQFIGICSYYQTSQQNQGYSNETQLKQPLFYLNISKRRNMKYKQKMPALHAKEITYELCKSLKECLSITPALTVLKLQDLSFREVDILILAKGLAKNNSLNVLSLSYCRVYDGGLELICRAVKNNMKLNTVNFTGCSLSWQGAEILAQVIKHQAMKRHSEAWKDSLRYRRPDLERMSGIRRITLNNNLLIGDQGALVLAEALRDDLWLKALDLQASGISTLGAKALSDTLQYNNTIVVLDLRNNPMIERYLLRSIMEQLMMNLNANSMGIESQYEWMKADELIDPTASKMRSKRKKLVRVFSGPSKKTTIRVNGNPYRLKQSRSISSSRNLASMKPSRGMPWRTAARANRHRGFPPDPELLYGPFQHVHSGENERLEDIGHNTNAPLVGSSCDDAESKPITTASNDSISGQKIHLDDSQLNTEVSCMRDIKVELEQLRRELKQERNARSRADSTIMELTLENERLRVDFEQLKKHKAILDDDNVLEAIEASFRQFHAFLDVLRDAGLGKLVTLAGLDEGTNMGGADKFHLTHGATSTPDYQRSLSALFESQGYMGGHSYSSFSRDTLPDNISSHGLYEKVEDQENNAKLDQDTVFAGRSYPGIAWAAESPEVSDFSSNYEKMNKEANELYKRISQGMRYNLQQNNSNNGILNERKEPFVIPVTLCKNPAPAWKSSRQQLSQATKPRMKGLLELNSSSENLVEKIKPEEISGNVCDGAKNDLHLIKEKSIMEPVKMKNVINNGVKDSTGHAIDFPSFLFAKKVDRQQDTDSSESAASNADYSTNMFQSSAGDGKKSA